MSLFDSIFNTKLSVNNGNNIVNGDNNVVNKTIISSAKKFIKLYSINSFVKTDNVNYTLTISHNEHGIDLPVIVKVYFKNDNDNFESILSSFEIRNDLTVVLSGAFNNIADEFLVVII